MLLQTIIQRGGLCGTQTRLAHKVWVVIIEPKSSTALSPLTVHGGLNKRSAGLHWPRNGNGVFMLRGSRGKYHATRNTHPHGSIYPEGRDEHVEFTWALSSVIQFFLCCALKTRVNKKARRIKRWQVFCSQWLLLASMLVGNTQTKEIRWWLQKAVVIENQ